ncbi:unnamed protein product [Cochlearia groenlandica]
MLPEIFIVEGDSAGGSAKHGRDRCFQAILLLRGKILNIERKDEAAMYKNEEIQNLILGLGLGVKGEDFNKENLHYHKIIIDVAGLGEMMPAQLWETTMNRDTRILKQLVVEDSTETNMVFSSLMFGRVSKPMNLPRLTPFISSHEEKTGETRVLFQVDVRKALIKSAATRINVENLDI